VTTLLCGSGGLDFAYTGQDYVDMAPWGILKLSVSFLLLYEKAFFPDIML